MKKALLLILIVSTSFSLGFALNSLIINKPNTNSDYKKVTGIGGIFFKCKSPKTIREWYKTHLGLNTNNYGTVFEWRQAHDSTKKGFTQWSPFIDSTKYFGSEKQDFMINYRVENLDALVQDLKKEGVTIDDKIESVGYGKFVHITDPEGNKIELWEPNDIEYEKIGIQMNLKTTK